MGYVEVTINKPLFQNYVNIRDIYVMQALRGNMMLKVTIPQGSAIVDPKEWIRTGNVTYQVFKIANKPMKLYGNFVPLPGTKVETPVINSQQLNLI